MALEAQSLKSRLRQSPFPLKPIEEGSSFAPSSHPALAIGLSHCIRHPYFEIQHTRAIPVLQRQVAESWVFFFFFFFLSNSTSIKVLLQQDNSMMGLPFERLSKKHLWQAAAGKTNSRKMWPHPQEAQDLIRIQTWQSMASRWWTEF